MTKEELSIMRDLHEKAKASPLKAANKIMKLQSSMSEFLKICEIILSFHHDKFDSYMLARIKIAIKQAKESLNIDF